MLDDTSPSGTCDLQKRRRIMPISITRISGQGTIRAGLCDMRLDPGGRIPQALCSRFVRRTRVHYGIHVPLRASSFMLYRPRAGR